MQLSNKYKREDFINFLEKDFLSDFKKDIRPVNSDGLATIQKAYTLGRSKSLGLEVFEICLNGSINKRISLTKDAFSIMKSTANFNALAIFYTVEDEEWRLSLMTLKSEKTEKGSAKISYSNPKRYSYLLGKNARINTPTKYLITKNKVIDFNDLKSRFSLEVVNKDFYNEISSLFMKLVGGTVIKGKKKVDYLPLLKLPLIEGKSRASLEFAVRLIGRIIFCWFLREKKSQSGKSLVPKELLSLDAVNSNNDYYHKILEPIFFEVLNRPAKIRKDFYRTIFFESIPYLNGGLFSPHEEDFFSSNEKKQAVNHDTVIIPDNWFKELFSVLETYNFTIDENISFDEELSIDPEMLGRIFENLLAEINPETGESARKSTGSYYTPRVIVDYMVEESIYSYLKIKTKINENKLRSIISYDFNDDTEEIITEEEKNKIIDALEKVKILDPACGSGAYPIGALQKIVFILQQVDIEGKVWFKKQIQNVSPEIKRVIEREFDNKNFDYIRKLGIIRENIYGIDIQPIATEISRLRCFLTLIVNESIHDDLDNRGIEPLPNLDFKFVTANSLIGLPEISKNNQTNLFEDRSGIEELKELRDMFFNASGAEKEELKLQFVQVQKRMFERIIKNKTVGMADLTESLTSWDPFVYKASTWFDSEWMFGIKEGFDIVIANPPYINIEKLDNDFKKYVFKNYETCAGRTDIYIVFLEKSFSLLKETGLLSFIIPYAFSNQKYGTKLRKMIIENFSIDEILDLSDYFVFDQAMVKNILLFVSKKKTSKLTMIKRAKSQGDFLNNKLDIHQCSQEEFLKLKDFRLETKDLSNFDKIKEKLLSNVLMLNDICFIGYGARINHKFKNILKSNYIFKEKISNNLKPYMEGKNIQKYKITQFGWLKYEPSEHYNPMFKELFDNDKIVFINVVKDNLRFAFDTRHFYNSHTVVNCVKWNLLVECNHSSVKRNINTVKIDNGKKFDYVFLVGLLNSNLINWYFRNFLSEKMHFYPDDAKNLPIKVVPKEKQEPLSKIVDKILVTIETEDYLRDPKKQAEVREYENQIDQMVYKLYELSPEEIKIVEDFAKN